MEDPASVEYYQPKINKCYTSAWGMSQLTIIAMLWGHICSGNVLVVLGHVEALVNSRASRLTFAAMGGPVVIIT